MGERRRNRHPRRAGRWLTLALLAALLPAALGGCLDEAQNKDFKFENPNDPEAEATGNVVIALVDTGENIVVIANQGLLAETLTGWTLSKDGQTNSFTFSAFTLNGGGVVRVHTNLNGTDTTSDLYIPAGGEFSVSGAGAVRLRDENSLSVSTCDEADPCFG